MSSIGAHILVHPYPAPGHIIPLLDLTSLLLTRGLTVTVLISPPHLPLLQPLLSRHVSSLHTLVLPLPATFALPKPGLLAKIRATCQLHDPILSWFRSHDSPPVAVVSDFFLGWTHGLATKLGVPRVVFWASGAFTASVYDCLWRNLPKNGDPANEEFSITLSRVPNCPNYPWWQVMPLCRNFKVGDADHEFIRENMLANYESWGAVFNSFDELERVYIDHIKEVMGHKRVWAVGPSLPVIDDQEGPIDRGGTGAVATGEVMTWLDDKADDCVVYVCFGSREELSSQQMGALAAALEYSGVHFIWCVKALDHRRGASGDVGMLPVGFEDRVGDRGFVIRGWAPQVEILRHSAVGSFLTHCGWNSLLEGIVMGVLMLTWPLGSDQFTDAKLLVDQLSVAVRACEGGANNIPDVAELTRLLSASASGGYKNQRARVAELRSAARHAVNGGSSTRDLGDFVEQINELVQLNAK